MKLYVKEDFDSIGGNEVIFTSDMDNISGDVKFTPDSCETDVYGNCITNSDIIQDVEADIEENEFSMYEGLEAIGFIFMLASNDIHTIHINACGENFKELHESADELYKLLSDYSDHCLEMCCEDGHYIFSLNDAKELLSDCWTCYDCGDRPFTIKEGTKAIIDILHNVTIALAELYPDCDSDVQSVMDEWSRELKSKMNYFLNRVVEVNHIFTQTNENIMSPYIARNRKRKGMVCEHLDKLKLGQSYTLFCQVEDHIEDYNCDPINLKAGDYIIRDFQFGHLPNGGNKGYIPYKVVDVVYDDISDNGGYYDRRTRLELDDGKEYFYVVCQNDRFNGMFHKLKNSSIQK